MYLTCSHPLKGFQVGFTKNNKPKYKITSYKVNHIEKFNNEYRDAFSSEISPYAEDVVWLYKEIPCGQCYDCRLDYSRMWADRCLLEMKNHEQSWFVTLTYNDEHLRYMVDDDGVISDFPTLVKRDFQLFMKRLRKNYKYNNKIRYFAAGEYGDKSLRPHYHAIIFGLKLDKEDLILYKKSPIGFDYYISNFLNEIWSYEVLTDELDEDGKKKKIKIPYGYVVVAPASWETCAYTARYVLKKQKGVAASVYDELLVNPPFTLMSRKPGIARDFFDEDPERFFNQDCTYVSTLNGSKEVYPSRYYKNLMEKVDADRYIEYNEIRALAKKNAKKAKLKMTSDSYLEMLSKQSEIKQLKTKSLKREL